MEMSQTTVREKNAGELFQSFVWHTRDVHVDHSKRVMMRSSPSTARRSATTRTRVSSVGDILLV
jgi:hypothetical protein